MRISLLAAAVIMFVLATAGATAATMYAVDDGTDSLYTVDLATGAATLVGSTGQNLSFSGLAYDTSTGTMYVSDVSNPASGAWGLGTVDLTTGAVSYVGDHVNSPDIHGLAYVPTSDTLYGTDIVNSCLATIDRSTGVSSCVGSWTTATNLRGLAYDAVTDALYATDATSTYTIDPSTGSETVVGAHGISLDGAYIGLDVDQDTGTLYAAGSGDGNLYTIDKATGASTSVGATGLTALSGLGSVAEGGTPVEPGIPATGRTGTALLILVLSAAGMLMLRRRLT